MKTLVIGGTGPTGPDVVRELLARDHEVVVLHRGTHEPDDPILAEVEHIHADPHFADTLTAALGARTFDLMLATYGRMTLNAQACRDRCPRFIGVGGNPVHAGHLDRRGAWPTGMRILAAEDAPRTTANHSDRDRFAARVRAAEEAVFATATDVGFVATYLRYPMVYGRRSMLGFERGLVARLRAGRHRIVLPDGGLSVYSRMADRNAAHLVGLVVDHPEISAGQVYQCADDQPYSVLQWAELACAAVSVTAEFVPVPLELAQPWWDLLPTGPAASRHTLVDTGKARRELGYRDVVRPAEVLADVMRELWERAPSVDLDFAAEDAVLAAHDRMVTELTEQLGRQDVDGGPARWHPYAHPRRTPAGEVSG